MVLGFIPVRGGSKSIPLKNIKVIAGKPLVYWTVKALAEAASVDRVVVATDSDQIAQTVLDFLFPKVEVFRRSATNAQDTSSTESVMLEYLAQSNLQDTDLFLLAQATSPLMTSSDVESVVQTARKGGADSVLTGVPFKRFLWELSGQPINYDPARRPRRQDFAGSLMENGALYVTPVGRLRATGVRISGRIQVVSMHEDSAYEIDEPSDWIVVEHLLRRKLASETPEPRRPVKLFLTDVDGVLTDGGMYYAETGEELKKFNTKDGLGLRLMQEAGCQVGIVTGENTKLVERRATKLRLDFLYQGVSNKLEVVDELRRSLSLEWADIAYVGDDLNDRDLLERVGWSACPADAVQPVKDVCRLQLSRRGGEGCVREFITYLMTDDHP